MSKLQNWRLKGSFIGANKNLTAMRCSGPLRFGVTLGDKNTTYVLSFAFKQPQSGDDIVKLSNGNITN